MRIVPLSFFIAACVFAISAQTHQQALEDFADLKQKAEALKTEGERLEKIIFQPDNEDLTAAAKENLKVFRILPREKYDKNIFKVRGGGAYYSFTRQSHSYDLIPQISLEQNHLNVGFYGAGYGFMTDLGKIALADINAKTKGVSVLVNYQPPLEESKARVEQVKARGFEAETLFYKNRLPAITGNSYLLRAVSYDEADVLVAFKIHRQDADGSLIIFWKLLENFEKPLLARNK
jgi:hypothetical protein